MEDSRAKELCRIGTTLFTKKGPWDSLCQEIADNYYPLRSDFTRELALGDDFSTGLMESFPVQSRETLGNAPYAMLRQGDWFDVKTGREEIDEDPEAVADTQVDRGGLHEGRLVRVDADLPGGDGFPDCPVGEDHPGAGEGNRTLAISLGS